MPPATFANPRPSIKSSMQKTKLTAETFSSNQRLADALAKTRDFSAIIPILLDALKTGGGQAKAEVADLIQQVEARLPGHGQKLADELGKNGITLQSAPAPTQNEPPRLAGGPDGSSGGLVHVNAYNQDRSGTSTHVSSYTRGGGGKGDTGSGGNDKGDTGPGRFYSKNSNDYHKGDGKVAEGRPIPVLKSPIANGKPRDKNSGGFNARRHSENGYYQHGGVDVLAKPGSPTTSTTDGEVTAIGTATEAENGKIYKYVEITTKGGYKVRQLYVKPAVKVGDTVKAGKPIGTVDNLAPRYGKDMPNHTHVEVYDTKTIVDNGRTDIKKYKRINPALLWN